MQRAFGACVAATALAVVSGCNTCGGVSIPPGGDGLEPCTTWEVSLDQVPVLGDPGCNLEGAAVVLADDERVDIPAVGTVSEQAVESGDLSTVLIVNWGVPGIGMTLNGADGSAEVVGSSPEARDLQEEQNALESCTTR